MSNIGKCYPVQGSKIGTVKRKQMKLTLKQRLRNWLMNSDNEVELNSASVSKQHIYKAME